MKVWCLQGWSCVQEGLKAAPFLSPSQPPATRGPLLWTVLSSPRSCQAAACPSNSGSQQGVPALLWPGPNAPLPCPDLPWAPAAAALCPLGVPSLHASQSSRIQLYPYILHFPSPAILRFSPGPMPARAAQLLSEKHCFSSLG